ncbi:GIY-YIG nuclease family protein [Citromicrobium bathyomarinum]|uniref:GIY-YIG nuclease family protein n=1 Tax=Citromicrobium bathyomarinum TaxID=72174 RepID=UPI001E454B7F|nr:GIY-YIG nuclease family protein [Citromicrobium bathyomarinum]MCD1622953.1 GIY-YIG nuclease family protein [Citromicrobium bathyomarinum]
MLNLFQHPASGNLRLMPTEKQPCVYILTSKPFGTLYIGVTSDLIARLWQHREGTGEGFTKRYAVHRLAHFELVDTMESAIKREKQLKNWHRDWKLNLITRENPDWRDLAIDLGFEPMPPDERHARP